MVINNKIKIIILVTISIAILSTGLYYINTKNKLEEIPYTLF